jgi:hypothetical protein
MDDLSLQFTRRAALERFEIFDAQPAHYCRAHL